MTLAITEAARGGAVLVTGGNTVSGLSSAFTFIGQGYIGPVPMAVVILLIAFAGMWVMYCIEKKALRDEMEANYEIHKTNWCSGNGQRIFI